MRAKTDSKTSDKAHSLEQRIAALLRRGNAARAKILIERILLGDGDVQPVLRTLEAEVEQQDSLKALFDVQKSLIDEKPLDLAMCANFLTVGRKLDRLDEAASQLARRAGDPLVPPSMWRCEEMLKRIATGHRRERSLIIALKYGEMTLDADADLIAIADDLAGRMRLSPSLKTFLFSRRRMTQMGETEWVAKVKRAFAIDHVFTDLATLHLPANLDGSIDQAAWRSVQDEIKRLGAVICLTLHGGLLGVLRTLFEAIPEGVSLQAGATDDGKGRIAAGQDSRAALFSALRLLLAGRPLLMTPDGPLGARDVPLDILGIRTMIGQGAPFLAYEANAPTMWISVSRVGDKLVPALSEGPRRSAGESYEDFKEKWISFYASQIESFLTGDPSNLALRVRWARPLSRAETSDRRAQRERRAARG